jgi:hypothetical protein
MIRNTTPPRIPRPTMTTPTPRMIHLAVPDEPPVGAGVGVNGAGEGFIPPGFMPGGFVMGGFIPAGFMPTGLLGGGAVIGGGPMLNPP